MFRSFFILCKNRLFPIAFLIDVKYSKQANQAGNNYDIMDCVHNNRER